MIKCVGQVGCISNVCICGDIGGIGMKLGCVCMCCSQVSMVGYGVSVMLLLVVILVQVNSVMLVMLQWWLLNQLVCVRCCFIIVRVCVVCVCSCGSLVWCGELMVVQLWMKWVMVMQGLWLYCLKNIQCSVCVCFQLLVDRYCVFLVSQNRMVLDLGSIWLLLCCISGILVLGLRVRNLGVWVCLLVLFIFIYL